jgi:hypothetical protein
LRDVDRLEADGLGEVLFRDGVEEDREFKLRDDDCVA